VSSLKLAHIPLMIALLLQDVLSKPSKKLVLPRGKLKPKLIQKHSTETTSDTITTMV